MFVTACFPCVLYGAVANVANSGSLQWNTVLLKGSAFDADNDMPTNADLEMDSFSTALWGGSVAGQVLMVDASDSTRYLGYRVSVDPSFSSYLIIVFDIALGSSPPDGSADFAIVADLGASKAVYVTGSQGTGLNTRPNNTDFYLAAGTKASFRVTDAMARQVTVGGVDDYAEIFINFDAMKALLQQTGSGGGTQIVSSALTGLAADTVFRYALTSSANLNNVNKDISGSSTNDGAVDWNTYFSKTVTFESPEAPSCATHADECSEFATCEDTSSGITCECNQGYSGDGMACSDVNECDLGTHDCSVYSTCTNTQGSFTCACNEGYSGDGVNCSDLDECILDEHGCSFHAACVNTVGSYSCVCNEGYAGDGVTCADIDECDLNVDNCSEEGICANTPGSFVCRCDEGYTSVGGFCVDVNECLDSGICSENGLCINELGSYSCVCNEGYAGDGVTCTDIDECDLNTDNCSEESICTNTPGSFVCKCDEGYTSEGGVCVDVNECLDSGICSENGLCINALGSYSCVCNAGYNGDGVTCTDVDECELNEDNCSENATCINTQGFFTCVCNAGYSGNGATCADVDECVLGTDNCSEHATCSNTQGSFTCACNAGYSGNGATCADVDECVSGIDNCSEHATCSNTLGSYVCSCDEGYLGNGFVCESIQECESDANNCSENAYCTNTLGSHTCTCSPGYSGDGVTCEDVDECALGVSECRPNSLCVNLPGSYQCSCLEGYINNGLECVDVNECEETPDVCGEKMCVNDEGSFHCECEEGYVEEYGVCILDEDVGIGLPDSVSSNNESNGEDVSGGTSSLDSDQDGIPDVKEKQLGTDPMQWDTDGDGLNDYLEAERISSNPSEYTHIEGSGCQSTQGSDMVWLLAALLGCLCVRQRKKTAAWALASAVWGVLGTAQAGVSAQRLRWVPQSPGFTSVVEGFVTPQDHWGVQAGLSYALNPIEFALQEDHERVVGIVSHLMELQWGVYGTAGTWLQWGVSPPSVVCGLAGNPKSVFAARILRKKGESCGIGDTSLFLKQRVLEFGKTLRWSASVVEEVRADTSTRKTFFGRGAWELTGGLASTLVYKSIRASANVFYDWVIENTPVLNATDDDKIRWGLGLAYRISSSWEMQAEYTGAGGLFVKNIPRVKDFFDPITTAHILDASVLWTPQKTWWMKLGVGAGLSRGVGVPDMRVFLQTGYQKASF